MDTLMWVEGELWDGPEEQEAFRFAYVQRRPNTMVFSCQLSQPDSRCYHAFIYYSRIFQVAVLSQQHHLKGERDMKVNKL